MLLPKACPRCDSADTHVEKVNFRRNEWMVECHSCSRWGHRAGNADMAVQLWNSCDEFGDVMSAPCGKRGFNHPLRLKEHLKHCVTCIQEREGVRSSGPR